MADSEAKWYILHTYSGYENKVAADITKLVENRNLQHLIEDVTIPTVTKTVEKENGDVKEVEEKIYPGYVFVNLEYTAENYYRVKEIPAVIRFLGASGLAPSQLTYLEAEWVKTLAGINGQPLQPTKVRELPDGSLKIVEGVLSNFAPRTIQYDKRSRRAKVEITLCGEPRTVQLSVEVVGSV